MSEEREDLIDNDPPDPHKIADSIVDSQGDVPRGSLRIIVHGLVLLMFKSRTSVTLLMPTQGAPDSEHAAFAKSYADQGSKRMIPLAPAHHWSVIGVSTPVEPVRRESSRTTEHPFEPVERILNMADVVGDIQMTPLRELIKERLIGRKNRRLIGASFSVPGARVRAEVPLAPLGWAVLWGVGAKEDKEVLCTDTAILTIEVGSKVSLKGRPYDGGEPVEIGLNANERTLFLGNIDTVRCRAGQFGLTETQGYTRLYPGAKGFIPQKSRSFLDHYAVGNMRVRSRLTPSSLVGILSGGCTPVCNLAQDVDEGWDDQF